MKPYIYKIYHAYPPCYTSRKQDETIWNIPWISIIHQLNKAELADKAAGVKACQCDVTPSCAFAHLQQNKMRAQESPCSATLFVVKECTCSSQQCIQKTPNTCNLHSISVLILWFLSLPNSINLSNTSRTWCLSEESGTRRIDLCTFPHQQQQRSLISRLPRSPKSPSLSMIKDLSRAGPVICTWETNASAGAKIYNNFWSCLRGSFATAICVALGQNKGNNMIHRSTKFN